MVLNMPIIVNQLLVFTSENTFTACTSMSHYCQPTVKRRKETGHGWGRLDEVSPSNTADPYRAAAVLPTLHSAALEKNFF